MINCRLLLMRFFKLVEYTSLFVNKKYHASALIVRTSTCLNMFNILELRQINLRRDNFMKKEYLFFLVLVLAAAVVTGATIGFISNFDYIKKHAQEDLSQIELSQQQAISQNSNDQSDSVKNIGVNPEDKDNYHTNNDVATPSMDQGHLILSREEKQQVIDMLISLGAAANDDGDYSTFIRNFQMEKSLPSTGSLDSLTLNAIINELTYQRAAKMANG